MIVMPANNAGIVIGWLAGRFPGRIGWLISPDDWKEPKDFLPYAFDNGAFPAWEKNESWQEAPFYDLCQRARGRRHKPRWAAVPDVVADREGTLRSWAAHAPRVAAFGIPLAFVVQDGMTPADVPEKAEVVFVGGTTEWKWRTLQTWTDNFPRVHVGRVNTERMLWMAHESGAESCDGTGWTRGGQKRIAGLVNYLEQSHKFLPTIQKQHMQKATKLAIAGLLSAAGAFFTAFAAEFSGEGSETTETTNTPKTRKPRNSATATAPAEQTTTAAAAEPEPETEAPQGKTYEDLKALIKPHVEGGKGQEVKDIIKKYSATGLKDMKAEHHEAFEKDLETLSY